jgi:aminomethyltransferase
MIDKGIPRHGYEIAQADGSVIGVVSSGTQSPSLGKAIGMGYVPTSMSAVGTEIYLLIRGKQLKAQVVSLPFYKQS